MSMNQKALIDFNSFEGQSTAVVLGNTKISYARFTSDICVMEAFLRKIEKGRRLRLGLLIEDSYWRWVLHLASIRRGHGVLTLRKERHAIEARAAAIDLVLTDSKLEASPTRHIKLNIPTYAPLAKQWLEFAKAEMEETKEESATRIVFTSGTTGSAKWVEWTFESMRNRIHLDGAYLEFSTSTRMYCPQAIHTTNGFRYPVATWRSGGAVILRDKNTPLGESLGQSNVIRAVPSTFASLLKSAPGIWPGASERHVALGGARLPTAVLDDALARACAKITISCGSTEAGSIAKGDSSLLRINPHYVGYILPDVNVEVVDENDAPQPDGIAGLLRIKTPYMVNAYQNDVNGDNKVFRNGWFYPGDNAIIQKDRLLILLGRSNQTINVNGQKFSVEKIEAELEKMPGLIEHCLISIPFSSGDRLGVVVAAQNKIDPKDLGTILKKYVDVSKVLPMLIQVPEIPRNDTGKISRADVTKFVVRRMARSQKAKKAAAVQNG